MMKIYLWRHGKAETNSESGKDEDRVLAPEAKPRLEKVSELDRLAKELGTSLTQLAIAWCAKNTRVSTVILGASREEQLVENLKAIEVLPKLTETVLAKIEAILQNCPARPVAF